ncbi:MAG: PLP-dependent aminotransferase family protein [bacterium]|nr:PLP-dependent aminotransferase family protein [bacterium]
MAITVDRENRIPAYIQIRNQLREQILRGDLPRGTRLPPERKMAQSLGVSRTTVVSAYDELAAEGLVEARVGRGTLIATPPSGLTERGSGVRPLAWTAHMTNLAKRLQGEKPAGLYALAELCNRADLAQLCNGVPDSSLLPLDRIRQACEAVLRESAVAAVSAGAKHGIAPLREVIASRLARAGIASDADRVVVINGAQQGFDLLVRLLTEPGDTVIVESPTYLGAIDTFQAEGLRVIGIPVDRDGMDVDQAEFVVARYRPRFIYTVPTFQNPTGTTMSLERREKLLGIARRYQVPIIEDDPFGDLYFDEPPPPRLKALDGSGHVLYLGTVSKVLASGLRVGWLVAPQPVVEAAARLKALSDSQPVSLSQHLVLEFMGRGWLDEHVDTMRAIYASRYRAMDAALRRHLPREASWTPPGGGISMWVELPQQVGAQELLDAAAPRGVVFLPGHYLYPGGGPSNTCRLNFSVPDEHEIGRGVEAMGSALRQVMRRRTQAPAERAVPGPIA